jgi:hypothetical protein
MRSTAPVRIGRQGGSLLQSRGLQAVQGLADRGGHGGLDGGAVLGGVLLLAGVDHAAQGQQAVQAGLGDHAGGHIGRAGLQIALQHLDIDLHGALRLGALGLQVDGQLAALEAGLGAVARGAVQAFEARRAAKTGLEVAAVDAARLHRPRPGPVRALDAGEAGHA